MKTIIFFLFFLFSHQVLPLEPDSQSHATIGFQSVLALERALHLGAGMGKLSSVMVANTLLLTAAYYKEENIDSDYDQEDINHAFGGALLSSFLFSIINDKSYELEIEGGLQTLKVQGDEPKPDDTKMVKASTTIWFSMPLGFHQFSGGYDTGEKDDKGKRLFSGLGIRLPIFPFDSPKNKKSILSTYLGVDYGNMLFATKEQDVDYKKNQDLFFYNLGLRLRFSKTIFLSGEYQYFDYDKWRVKALNFSLGLAY